MANENILEINEQINKLCILLYRAEFKAAKDPDYLLGGLPIPIVIRSKEIDNALDIMRYARCLFAEIAEAMSISVVNNDYKDKGLYSDRNMYNISIEDDLLHLLRTINKSVSILLPVSSYYVIHKVELFLNELHKAEFWILEELLRTKTEVFGVSQPRNE